MRGLALLQKNNKLECPAPALITVCVSQNAVDELEAAMAKRRWKDSVVVFDSYMSSSRRPYLSSAARSADACIAFIDFDKSQDCAAESAQYLMQAFAGKITIVAITKSQNSEKILTAMRAGCTDFLSTPLEQTALADIFDRLEEQWLATRWRPSQTGTVLSFFGVKGGAGSTTLAVHVAAYLAKYHKKKTLLIDHHPQLGHICTYLGLDGSRYQFQEVVRNVNRLDSELLRGFVTKHASGLDVLSSPETCSGRKPLDKESIAATLEFLRGEYEYIVLDCNIDCEEHNLAVLATSQYIYMVSTQEVGSIRNLSRYIDRFTLLDAPLEKLQIVLNRLSASDAIQVEPIEKALKLPIVIRIPNGGADLIRAANLGEPLLADSKSALTAKLAKWAETITGVVPLIASEPVRKPRTLISVWK